MPKQSFLRVSRDQHRLCVTGMSFKVREDLKALGMRWISGVGWVKNFSEDKTADSIVTKLRGIAARHDFKFHALHSTISS